jgi:hypothetical protein
LFFSQILLLQAERHEQGQSTHTAAEAGFARHHQRKFLELCSNFILPFGFTTT